MALLKYQNLQTHFRTPDGGVEPRRRRSQLQCRRGRDRRHRGRVRLREVSDRNVYPPAYLRAAGSDGRSDPFQRQRFDEAIEREMRDIRGNEIGMIFQEPMTSLNPVLSIGRQIGEALQLIKYYRSRKLRPRRSRC